MVERKPFLSFWTEQALIAGLTIGSIILLAAVAESFLGEYAVREYSHDRLDEINRDGWLIELRLRARANDMFFLKRVAENELSRSPDASPVTDNFRSAVSTMMLARSQYEAISLLDPSGHEIFRDNWKGEGQNPLEEVPSAQLLDRSDQSYFRDTLNASPDSAVFSSMQLSAENKKPVVRICGQIVGPDGKTRAIVVLSYLGDLLLREMRQGATLPRHKLLLDNKGFWLIGPTPESEGGYLSPEKPGVNFSQSEPELWAKIASSKTGSFDENGELYCYETIDPIGSTTDYPPLRMPVSGADRLRWTLLTKVPNELVWEDVGDIRTGIWVAGAASVAILVPLICFGFIGQRQRLAESMARSRAEKELRDQALILDLANDTIFIRDNEDRITYWNQGAHRLYGWSKEEALGQVSHGLLRTRFPQPLADIKKQLHSQGHWEGELVQARRDGLLVTVASSWTLRRDESGQLVSIIETNYDLTSRKKAERELAVSRTRLNAILQGSLDGIIVFESVRDEAGVLRDLRFAMINPATEKLMGRDGVDLLGKTLLEKFPNSGPDGLFEKYARVIEDDVALDFEHLSNRSDPPRWYRIAGVKLGDGLVVSYNEITNRKQYEQQLQDAKQRAESADRAKSDFLANMSHEIRTPMNGVIGMTGLLLNSKLDPDQRHLAETARNSAESLLGLINDILDFSKIEAGKLVFEELDFDLRKVVEDTLEMMAGQAEEKGIELVLAVEPRVDTALRGDAGRFQQLLTNLIGNAVKFTEVGEVITRVSAEAETAESFTIRVEVIDTGVGISPEVQSRLFRSFVQADGSTSRKFGGTGLGLAICKRLAEAMNGEIGVRSELGKGSTFWVTLKFLRQSSAGVQPPNPPEFANARVLVIDDSETNRQYLVQELIMWGVRSKGIGTGEEALAMLRQSRAEKTPYNLAVIDLRMVGMDGLTLVENIKADPQIRATRIILLTPFGKPVPSAEMKRLGIAASCVKPVRRSDLYDCLVQVLTHESPADAAQQLEPFIRSTGLLRIHKVQILLAEDNDVNQQVALGSLRKLGYTADVALDGVEVLTAIERKSYDIILMDCQMPEMDGYEVTREIRRLEHKDHRTWIIAMTANVMVGDRERCLAAGMDDYLSKPISREELRAALERAASRSVTRPDEDISRSLEQFDRGDLAELIDLFAESAPKTLEQMKNAIARYSASDLCRTAHTLKGSCSNFGAAALRAACVKMEEAGQVGDLDTAGELMVTVEAELTRLIKTLNAYPRT